MTYEINKENEDRFPEDTFVLVWYPPRDADDRDRRTWEWLPGTILCQGGPDEWCVVVEVKDLAVPDPSVPNGDAPENLLFPTCFRDSSEIRAVSERRWEEAWREWSGD